MVQGKMWSIKGPLPEGAEVTLDGRILTDEKEIIEFIDTYMKPYDIDVLPDPELEWEFMRSTNIFHMLFNEDDRVKAYVESIATRVNLAIVIHRRVKERYPKLGWKNIDPMRAQNLVTVKLDEGLL